MRAREWLYEVKDPKVAALQRDLRKAGALNVEGPYLGEPLRVDGKEGPNTRYNMDLPQFAGIVRQHKNPSAPHARNTVADADSMAPGEELVPQSTVSNRPNPNIDAATRQRGLDSVKGITSTPASPLPSLAPAPIPVGPDDYVAPRTAPKELTPQQQALSQAAGIAGAAATTVTGAVPTPTSIDPIVRKRQGLPPATTAEIDAYAKAHPAVVGGVVDGSGKPIISGAAAEIEKDARKAAKDLETKQGPNPNISNDTRVKAKADLTVNSDIVGPDGSITIGNEKRIGGNINWRANNPGNNMMSPLARSLGAVGHIIAKDKEPVAIMPTMEAGVKLQMAQWRAPKYNNVTIDQGCRMWAQAVGDKKETSQYTIDLARAAGATIDTKVKDLTDEQLAKMCLKQAKWEGGPNTVKTVAVNNTKPSTATA
jgi:hypothetical protein